MWDRCNLAGRPLPNGIYFVRFVVGDQAQVAKAVMVK
jgi:hypothetical protein